LRRATASVTFARSVNLQIDPNTQTHNTPCSMKGSLVLFIALLALVAHSCKDNAPTTPTPEPQRLLTLTTADSSLHEIWLRLSLPDSLSGRSVKIYRNDTLRFAFDLVRRDTVLMDSGLALGTRYTYRAVRLDKARTLDSTQVSTATMPTTSHAVVWRIDTLGTTATWLNDVCVVNDTCIWVVGQIHAPPQDSLGYWTTYNAARFDGERWHFYSFQFPLYNGDGTVAGYYNGECRAVFGLSPTSVFFSDGGGIMVWNGVQARYLFQSLAVSKIWASSENDIYVVGGNGFIAHYNGSVWRRVESGTTTVIQDVWGSIDKATGDTLVLATVSTGDSQGERKILQIKRGIPAQPFNWVSGVEIKSIYFRNHRRFFAAGAGVWTKNAWQAWQGVPSNVVLPTFKRCIRGTSENNVFVVGDFSSIVRFDGTQWHIMSNVPNTLYKRVSTSASTIACIGDRGVRGYVVIFKMEP